MPEKILIIDDEEATVHLIAMLLEKRGFETIKAYRAEEGLRKAYRHQPDLVLLDIMMPEMNGWEICKRLREMSDVPVVFLTARSDVKDVVKGLELGADDYITKPYDNDELVARVRAHLRRSPRPNMSEELVFDDGEFRINFMNREVWVRNEIRHLTPKEFNLLAVLVRNAGRVVTRTELVTLAWGEEYSDAIDSLKLYIHYLRQKVEVNAQQPEYIITSRGVGYRFVNR
jgi:two-component system KDP operon response regulator KdpE